MLKEFDGISQSLVLAFEFLNLISIFITISPKVCKIIIKNQTLLKSSLFIILTRAQNDSLQTIL